tara:strand:- start:12 stop:164 length:153 start_codon:yes stop_codon:yes gene_type:complete
MNLRPVVQVRKLGLAAYDAVTDLQQQLFQRTIDQKIHNRRKRKVPPFLQQ